MFLLYYVLGLCVYTWLRGLFWPITRDRWLADPLECFGAIWWPITIVGVLGIGFHKIGHKTRTAFLRHIDK